MPKKPPPAAEPPRLPPFLAGDDKRSVILRAAHKLFLRDGFPATSMDAVTQEAGVSKATVYAHFAGKEQLFETLIRHGSESVLATLPALERKGGDPRAELRAFFEPLLDLLFGSAGCAWNRMLIAEAQRHPENAEFFHRCTIARITGAVEAYLAELARDGVLHARDPRLAAEALVAMVLVGPLHRALLLGPTAVDYRTALGFGIDLLLGGDAPPFAPGPPAR